MRGRCHVRPDRERGFSLVEVLVAMVVIAVGMLGVAVLYVEGMKAGRTSIYRTSAVNLAADLADRMRANPTGAVSYSGAAADTGCTNGFIDCSPEQLAQEDLWSWTRDIGERLPAGADGEVLVAPGDLTNRYTIRVTWDEAGFDQPQVYAVTFDM